LIGLGYSLKGCEMHNSLNWLSLFLILFKDVIQSLKVHNVMLMELHTSIKFFGRYFIGYDLLYSWQYVRETVGKIINDDAFKLSVLKDLNDGM
jgi:hypothetical protein